MVEHALMGFLRTTVPAHKITTENTANVSRISSNSHLTISSFVIRSTTVGVKIDYKLTSEMGQE